MEKNTKPVRAAHDTLYARLSAEDTARAKRQAKRYGLTMAGYITALVRGESPFVIPASHARLGACIVDAITALITGPRPDAAKAIGLLREAQRLGAEFARLQLPAYNASHVNDEPWDAPDRPERRAR